MRPLNHPNIEDITVEGVIYALSDPVRVEIFKQLAASELAHRCSNFISVSDTPLAKSTLSQHFRILREAGLIRSERKGVELHNRTRCAELKERFGPMIHAIIDAYEAEAQLRKQVAKKRTRKKATAG